MKKITWSELCNYLEAHHESKGVVVFKVNPTWKKQDYALEQLSYVVEGKNKFFYNNMISTSIWASNLSGDDKGVRLDWYMFYEQEPYRWIVDYCYILES